MKLHVTMPDLTETIVSFDELLQKKPYTVLYFYPKDKTSGCTIQANEYTELYDAFAQKDTQIIGVSKDPHKSHCGFISKESISFPLISDTEQLLHNDDRFGVWVEKSMYGRKYMGTVRSAFLLSES